MFIYNITMQVEWSIHEAWLQWMLDIHIPEILGTGYFTKHQFVRLIEIDETEGPTYALQLYTENKENYDRYMEICSATQMQEQTALWANSVVSFSTLMKVMH
jgi:hypothetical protein